MPFDPALPAEGSELQSAVVRGQLTALFDSIQAIVPVVAAEVDGVGTLPAGEPANVTVSVSGGTLHFSFEIPQGQDGSEGATGPPFASAIVDGVTTLDPGEPATVDVSFDGTDVHFSFGIPRGSDGVDGQPGEVSQSQLDDAISGTSANSDTVEPFDSSYKDPDAEELRQKVNELINALRR